MMPKLVDLHLQNPSNISMFAVLQGHGGLASRLFWDRKPTAPPLSGGAKDVNN
jgi:hypothetical protein